MGFLSHLFRKFNSKSANDPIFTELSVNDCARLEHQRGLVLGIAKQRYGIDALTGTLEDLPVLQMLVDDGVFDKSQTYELQCLGVAFGDVLTSQLQLRWVMITDEYGTDPTLRFRESSMNVNALTMISKRVEGDHPIDLSSLLRITREQLRSTERGLR